MICPRCGSPANHRCADSGRGNYHPDGIISTYQIALNGKRYRDVFECQSDYEYQCFTILDIETGELLRWHRDILIPIKELVR